jgi:hypothetical protein
MFGSVDAFTEDLRAGMEAGMYDRRDMPVVIAAIERWHREVWA